MECIFSATSELKFELWVNSNAYLPPIDPLRFIKRLVISKIVCCVTATINHKFDIPIVKSAATLTTVVHDNHLLTLLNILNENGRIDRVIVRRGPLSSRVMVALIITIRLSSYNLKPVWVRVEQTISCINVPAFPVSRHIYTWHVIFNTFKIEVEL